MNEIYEERRFCVGPGEWDERVARLRAAAGARLFGVFRGQIGLDANEGVLLAVYSEPEALADALRGAQRVSAARMFATSRPAEPCAPKWRPGVYAFRSFDVRAANAKEFTRLSESAWPEFESAYDAQIIGLWRNLDVPAPDARFHLLTRYASLACWEASRADVGRPAFAQRAKLTLATRVVTTTLA